MLSRREKEAVYFAAQGLIAKEIAREMHISTNTVFNHLSHASEKLGAKNRANLVYLAVMYGQIKPGHEPQAKVLVV